MIKVFGFALVCFSLGLLLSYFLNGFAVKFLTMTTSFVLGCLLFHKHC